MTITNPLARERYESVPAHVRRAIDDAFEAAQDALKERGLAVASDDRAENLVDAIMVYVLESAGSDLYQ